MTRLAWIPAHAFKVWVQGVFFLILTLGWTSPPAFDKLALWMLSLLLVRAGSRQ
jgi:hypothetical protein